MKTENKHDKIKSLNIPSLKGLLTNLIQKLGFIDVQIFDELIVAKTNNPLTKVPHGFVFFDEKLSGISDAKDYISAVQNFRKANGFITTSIVSKDHISNAVESKIKAGFTDPENIDFIDKDRLIELIEQHYPDYWKHDNLVLLGYEKEFCDTILKENEIKKLKIFNDKYQKLLDIFIEPRIYHLFEDPETKTPIRKKVTIEQLIDDKHPLLISGEAGTGKSTTLKKIGELLIKRNAERKESNIPVYLNTIEIFENNYDILKLIQKKLETHFEFDGELLKDYKICCIIDSIDEFEDDIQNTIFKALEKLKTDHAIKYIVGTRNFEKVVTTNELLNVNTYYIEKFNTDQVRQFVAKFFQGESSRADELLDALRDNRILEKLPVTPLTLSLISILFEENNLEIPATITDIYDNFNSLLTGRAIVARSFELIDVSFRERILSLYALELLKRTNHTPMTRDEFIDFFVKYYESKTLPIKKGSLYDLLDYLINNTGILGLKNGKYVHFSHDSFMEYYGALEIFKHQREMEHYLWENFFETNWQNSAIFYAGKSKDLPLFLEKVIEKLKSAKQLNEFYLGVIGCGYILQALYQTDNKLRKIAVDEALRLNIMAHELMMKLSSDNPVLFKNYKLPILYLMNLLYFYENFNSITLRDALRMSFADHYKQYEIDKTNTTTGYKALKLAFTLNSKRLNEPTPLEDLIFKSNLTNDVSLTLLADFALEIFKGDNYKELKKEVRKEFPKMKESFKKLTEIPASRLRFSGLDSIKLKKKVNIIAEGKHDVEIIEHAFMTLTGQHQMYFSLAPAGNESGGAAEVAKTLKSCKPLIEDGQICIGIFDHDAKGLQEFNGLNKDVFLSIKNNTVKKHITENIFAICIPVSAEKSHYLKAEQPFNYFEIEHYFDDSLLNELGVLSKTPIENIYSIKDSQKKSLSKHIRSLTDPKVFKGFTELFKLIDEITKEEIEYLA